MIEITIKVSADDLTLIEKHLIYEEGICLSHNDPTLSKLVKATIDAFKCSSTPDVLVKIKYPW